MKWITAFLLVSCASCEATASNRVSIEEFYNARARYHHSYRHRSRDRLPTRDSSSHKSDRLSTWPTETEAIPVPTVTGTMILDKFTGRKPVVGPTDCANPAIDWYQRKGVSSWIDVQVDH